MSDSKGRRLLRPSPVVASSLRRYGALNLVCLVVVLAAATVLGARIARDEALREARSRAELITEAVVGPLVTSAVREHRPGAETGLEAYLERRSSQGALAHVKIWSADGEVIWSDEKELVGRRFELEQSVARLFGTQGAVSELSTLDKAENELERHERELLEVYAGGFDADGEPIVFEAYLYTDQMHDDQRAITAELMALTGGSVLLLQLLLLPLALSLAEEVERGEADRGRMVSHALRASEFERRRIAQDLHDGVIQDLAGAVYALPTVAGVLPPGDRGESARRTVTRVVDLLHRDVAALRTMLIDVTPPSLDGPGALRQAVEDLCDSAREGGVDVRLEWGCGDLPLDSAALVYRVIREGLRNVVKHAPESTVRVGTALLGERVQVVIEDDGPGDQGRPVMAGHKGLALLSDTLRDLEGELTFTSSSHGALLRAAFPLRPGER